MKPNSKKGFTLIELIVVVFLIALSASIVFINVRMNKALNSEEIFLKKFIDSINEARINSIIKDKKEQIIIDGFKRMVKISNSKKEIKIPESITISAEFIISKGDKHFINFYSDGSSSGAELEIIGKKFKKKIIIQKFNPKIILKNETS